MDPSTHIQKFLFLAILVIVVVFAKHGDVSPVPSKEISRGATLLNMQNDPPLFILEPPKSDASLQIVREVVSLEAATAPADLLPKTPTISPTPVAKGIKETPPLIKAHAAIVENLESGKNIFALRADENWPMASITKLVSAAIVSREINMLSEVELVESDFRSAVLENGLRVGGLYTARDLTLAMLLKSSNESAEAFARTYSAGRDGFISRMNALVKGWGLTHTNFDDPTGLSPANQSTAEDLVKLANRIYGEHPEIFEITRRKEAVITELKSRTHSLIKNINLFAGREEFVGGKTGYTDEAGGNLLTVFSRDGGPIAIVVLGSPDRFGETELLLNWFRRNF